MQRSSLLSVAAVTAAFAVGSGLFAQDSVYRRDGKVWIRNDGADAYYVHPDVVTVRSNADRDVQSLLDAAPTAMAGAKVLRSNRLGFHDVVIPPGMDVLDYVGELRASGLFASVEENTIGRYVGTPNDPSFSSLWHLENTGQTGGTSGADVSALAAWDIEDGDPSIVVAVLDSGTEWTHPDLSAGIWSNPGETLNGADSDGNGFVDDVRGWNFSSNSNDPSGSFTHGTWVAGVINATGQNGIGIVGLAGGGNDGTGVTVMPCNVGDFSPDGSILDDAILYAADNGAHIITLSLSIGTSAAVDAAVDDAVNNQGVFIDCASGNNGSSVSYPAVLIDIMAVASTNDDDDVSFFSNPGPEVEVAAPGEDILMTQSGATYGLASGTSFAAPHVAALASLLLSRDPSLTNAQLRNIIRVTADDIDAPGVDNDSGSGRINAEAALASLSVTGSVTPYGVGTAGVAGIPTIGASAVAVVGGNLDLTTSSAAPNAGALLGIGFSALNFPFFGGTLNIHPKNSLRFAVVLDGGGAGLQPLSIPADGSLAGAELFGQWFVFDAAAPANFAMSQGLELVIGS